jgi:hypothetical protein
METWNLFTGSDILLGLIGAAGLLSVIVVLSTASSNVSKREVKRRQAIDAILESQNEE